MWSCEIMLKIFHLWLIKSWPTTANRPWYLFALKSKKESPRVRSQFLLTGLEKPSLKFQKYSQIFKKIWKPLGIKKYFAKIKFPLKFETLSKLVEIFFQIFIFGWALFTCECFHLRGKYWDSENLCNWFLKVLSKSKLLNFSLFWPLVR